jgi:3-oxoacyl-[acyl-carrier protein] reductase
MEEKAMFDLTGKTALVTGATGGIGEAVARALHARGATLAVSGTRQEKLDALASDLKERTHVLACNLGDKAEVDALVGKAEAAMGQLDILVNNAGINFNRAPLTEMTEEQFDCIFAVNVKSIYLFAQAVVPHFRKVGGGVIINIGSTAGLRPRPGLTWYNTSKGAVNLASKSMALELAPDKIRVCALAPTIGETALLASFMGGDSEELRAKFRAGVPLGRLSTPQDVANAALFLASDEADFLTGVVLEVDGGKSV